MFQILQYLFFGMTFLHCFLALLLFLTTVLAGKCPGGFIEHDNNCYKVSSDKLSWNKARFACQSLEGNYDLAVVNNLELFEFLKAYNSHWIGLYSPGAKREFRWVDGSELEFGKPIKQKPWGDNEPNDFGSVEDCVHTSTAGRWNDYSCEAEFNYICGPAFQQWCEFVSEYECDNEYVKSSCPDICSSPGCEEGWQEYENSCYKMVVETMAWNEAEKDCVKRGAHLASIHSPEEMTFVNMLHDPNGIYGIWIGGLRDGRSFKWIDGSAFIYQNWVMGQPDNDGGKQNCIVLVVNPEDQKYHEKWNDVECYKTPFIIDRYICKKDK